jgi:hypothetical protein
MFLCAHLYTRVINWENFNHWNIKDTCYDRYFLSNFFKLYKIYTRVI